MILFPEAQKKAQKEIDKVVGPNRLPDWTDAANLPYARSCVKETLRCKYLTQKNPKGYDFDTIYRGTNNNHRRNSSLRSKRRQLPRVSHPFWGDHRQQRRSESSPFQISHYTTSLTHIYNH